MTGGPALVVGSGGVGRAVALALAGTGRPVAIVDRDLTALHLALDDAGHASLPAPFVVEADVTDPAGVAGAVERAAAHRGAFDVLVNATGSYGERVPFLDCDPERWWAVQEANVRGPMLCTRAVLPGMVARRRGLVVQVVSRAAVWDDPGGSSTAYAASKAALTRFTGALAAEVAGSGVVVVALSPGMVRTAMTADRPDLATLPDDAFVPLGRAGAAVVALASGRLDALHGRFVHATDDLDELARRAAADPTVRTLALVPHGSGDPLGPPIGARRAGDDPGTLSARNLGGAP